LRRGLPQGGLRKRKKKTKANYNHPKDELLSLNILGDWWPGCPRSIRGHLRKWGCFLGLGEDGKLGDEGQAYSSEKKWVERKENGRANFKKGGIKERGFYEGRGWETKFFQ